MTGLESNRAAGSHNFFVPKCQGTWSPRERPSFTSPCDSAPDRDANGWNIRDDAVVQPHVLLPVQTSAEQTGETLVCAIPRCSSEPPCEAVWTTTRTGVLYTLPPEGAHFRTRSALRTVYSSYIWALSSYYH